MNDKKGFTLIELLAVIVILAVIALIATPVVLSVIEYARDGSVERSAVGYVNAVENSVAKELLNNGQNPASGDYSINSFVVEMTGTLPSNGVITLDSSGTVPSASLCINQRKVDYDNKDAKVDKSGTCDDIGNIDTPPLPQADSCFVFDDLSGFITDYVASCGTDVVIPNTISGVPVVAIDEGAFYNYGLTSLYIYDGILAIGPYAFETNFLTSIRIPSTLVFMADEAFNDNLLPNDQAFIYARNSDTSIDYTTLVSYGGALRDDYVIPSSVETISSWALSYNNSTSLIIPSTVTSILDNAFDSNNLTKIVMESSNVNLGSNLLNWDNQHFKSSYIMGGAGTYNGTQSGIWTKVCTDPEGCFTPEYCFTFDEATQSITGYDDLSCSPNVNIPSKIDGLSVLNIADGAFFDTNINSLTIPSSVVYIGHNAIDPGNSSHLDFIEFKSPNVTLEIDSTDSGYDLLYDYSHYGAGRYDGVSDMEQESFLWSYDYDENLIVSGCYTIDSLRGFITSYSLSCSKSVVIPSIIGGIAINGIDENAFEGLEITSVTLPNSISKIRQDAFSNNYLTTIVLPNSLTNIDKGAFRTNQLTTITIPSSVEEIGNYAFIDNNLNTIIMSTSGVSIRDNMLVYDNDNFRDAYDLDGSGVYHGTQSGTWAVELPPAETGGDVIIGSISDPYHVYDSATPTAESCFGFDEYSNTIYEYHFGDSGCTTDVVIPVKINGTDVKSIQYSSFYGYGLTSVIIPYGIENIGSGAFNYNNISEIVIPSSVNIIESNAFSENQISLIQIGVGVEQIYSQAFSINQISSIYIPSTVSVLGAAVLNENVMPNSTAFIYARNENGSQDNRKLISYGGEDKLSLEIPNNVEEICPYSLSYLNIEEIILPNSVKTIGDYSLDGNLLTNVNIPDSVKTIGYSAFGSNQINTLTLPNSVTTIGDNAFSYNQLSTIAIPSSVTSFGQSVFSSNQISSFSLPNGMVKIPNGTFEYNILTSVTIPNFVTHVESRAFDYNQISTLNISNSVIEIGGFYGNNLTEIVIPSNVKKILSSAFARNQISGSVIIPNSVTSIGIGAFAENNIESLDIGNGLVSLESYAFWKNNIVQGDAIIRRPLGSIPSLGTYIFSNNGPLKNTTITPIFEIEGVTYFVDSRDSNRYATVQIGGKTWFAENLRYVGNGCTSQTWNAAAPHNACKVHGAGTWNFEYNDEVIYQYGAAMNGATAEGSQGICPVGWHIPTKAELDTLSSFTGTELRDNFMWNGSNTSGFSITPAGARFALDGDRYNFGAQALFWTSSDYDSNNSYASQMKSSTTNFFATYREKAYGASIRCVSN